jgi:DNA polymerase III subunit delta
MILKAYEIKKIDTSKNNIILFYGQNQGAKKDEIEKLLFKDKEKNFSSYDEKQILENTEIFYDEILSKSLFEDKKTIIINRATDKTSIIIEDLLEKGTKDVLLIINADNLEKKSKLRSLFEKNKLLICVAFYSDTPEILSKLTYSFIKKNNISISQANINLIINKCNGDRGILKNELEKIQFFLINGKKLSTENLSKLINLIENFSVSELIDNCLAKNPKKVINILNENTYNSEDCIIIIRTFLNKLKRILKLSLDYQKNKNLNQTITNAKPPIFWKDKEIIKQQINKWLPNQINKLIFDVNDIELQIKKNNINSINIITNFILSKAS